MDAVDSQGDAELRPAGPAWERQAQESNGALEKSAWALVVLASLAVLVLPLFFMPALVVALYDLQADTSDGAATAGASVGVAVILRAAIRRMFQGGLRVALQTSVSHMTRVITRAIARRELRLLIFTAVAAMRSQPDAARSSAQSWLALALGVPALALSFYILLLVPMDDGGARLPALLPSGRLSATDAAMLAAVPLLMYAGAAYVATRVSGARLSMNTGVDSVLIQFYFAAGGSFLPLATDSYYHGSQKACAIAATISLSVLLLSALVLRQAAAAWPLPGLQLLAPLCVVYAFVYAFPIRPLDGSHLWRASRWLWAFVWTVCLAALIWTVPTGFDAIL